MMVGLLQPTNELSILFRGNERKRCACRNVTLFAAIQPHQYATVLPPSERTDHIIAVQAADTH